MGGNEAKIVIAGTGMVEARAIDTQSLKVDVVGSGKLRAAGKAKEMKLTVAGSGDAEMDGLNVDEVKVDVAGSGNARFASNGHVNASIMGSAKSACSAALPARSVRWARASSSAKTA